MRVSDVEVKQVPTQEASAGGAWSDAQDASATRASEGQRIQLTVTTDDIPARALLDRGEAFMLAYELLGLARRVELT